MRVGGRPVRVQGIDAPLHLEGLVQDAFMTDPASPAGQELLAGLVDARAAGLDDEEILVIAQAYARAVARIVAAEAPVNVRMAAARPDVSAADLFDQLEPLSIQAFGRLHRHGLVTAVERLEEGRPADGGVARLAVAFVDLRRSTKFMIEASDAEVCDLVDALFLAGQAVAGRHRVGVGKHLGDGLLLVGPDTACMLEAVDEAVRRLTETTPLRAGAGVAFGRVISRAGDHFGPTVNLAQRLAELAKPDEVLVAAEAVPDPDVPGRWIEVDPRGFPGHTLVLEHQPLATRT